MSSQFRKKYIGTRGFYKSVMVMVIPMILQMMVTNLVSLIDNIMVGRLGTEPMSGVSIINQFVFVFNVTIFGAVAGPSIFGAQFFMRGRSTHSASACWSVPVSSPSPHLYAAFSAPHSSPFSSARRALHSRGTP